MHDFKQFGLSHYEGKALDILLREQVTPKILSKKARIPLGKVYSVISSLQRRGLVDDTQSRPKQLFIQNPGIIISKLIEQKQIEDETTYSELRKVASQAAAVRSQPSQFFQLGITVDDNKEIQLRTFREAKHEVCQIINIHHKPDSNRSSKITWEREINATIKRGVKFRALYPTKTILPQLLKNLPKEKFSIRRIDVDFTRCDIIDKKKVLIKLIHKDPLAFGGLIFIEDEKFAKNLQKVFEQFWEQAK